MEQLEKVRKALGQGFGNGVGNAISFQYPCMEKKYNVTTLLGDALALIRRQQERIKALEAGQRVKDMARLITEEDFKKADAWGIIPAWIEYRPELESAEDGWELIDCNVFHNVFKRAWTQRPTDEQREAVKWE